MMLTVDELIQAILSARHLETLQAEVRSAMIAQLVQASPLPASTSPSGDSIGS